MRSGSKGTIPCHERGSRSQCLIADNYPMGNFTLDKIPDAMTMGMYVVVPGEEGVVPDEFVMDDGTVSNEVWRHAPRGAKGICRYVAEVGDQSITTYFFYMERVSALGALAVYNEEPPQDGVQSEISLQLTARSMSALLEGLRKHPPVEVKEMKVDSSTGDLAEKTFQISPRLLGDDFACRRGGCPFQAEEVLTGGISVWDAEGSYAFSINTETSSTRMLAIISVLESDYEIEGLSADDRKRIIAFLRDNLLPLTVAKITEGVTRREDHSVTIQEIGVWTGISFQGVMVAIFSGTLIIGVKQLAAVRRSLELQIESLKLLRESIELQRLTVEQVKEMNKETKLSEFTSDMLDEQREKLGLKLLDEAKDLEARMTRAPADIAERQRAIEETQRKIAEAERAITVAQEGMDAASKVLDALSASDGGKLRKVMPDRLARRRLLKKTAKQRAKLEEARAELEAAKKVVKALRTEASRMEAEIGELEQLRDNGTDRITELREKAAEKRIKGEILERDAEALRFLEQLSRPEYGNPLERGISGVGKDAIVERAAQLVAIGVYYGEDAPPAAKQALEILRAYEPFRKLLEARTFKMLKVDPIAFQAGTKYRGEPPARLKLVVEAMREGYPAYFPEFIDFMAAGMAEGTISESMAAQLKDVLTKEWARLAGSGTPEAWGRLTLQHPDFIRRVLPNDVEQLPVSSLETILRNSVARWYEMHYGVRFEEEAVRAALNLGIEHLHLGAEKVPLVDACKRALTLGFELVTREARENGGGAVTLTADHVRRAMEESVKRSISSEEATREVDWDAEMRSRREAGQRDAVETTRARGIEMIATQLLRDPATVGLVVDGEVQVIAERLYERWTGRDMEERIQITEEMSRAYVEGVIPETPCLRGGIPIPLADVYAELMTEMRDTAAASSRGGHVDAMADPGVPGIDALRKRIGAIDGGYEDATLESVAKKLRNELELMSEAAREKALKGGLDAWIEKRLSDIGSRGKALNPIKGRMRGKVEPERKGERRPDGKRPERPDAKNAARRILEKTMKRGR